MAKAGNYAFKRTLFYWLSMGTSFGLPVVYYATKIGVTKEASGVILPITLILFLAAIKIALDIPRWISTWSPSFIKGLVRAIPIYLLFIMLITLGLTLKVLIDRQVQLAFMSYFETVLVIFGSMTVGSVFNAFHLKYKELTLISKGYVLGVVNR